MQKNKRIKRRCDITRKLGCRCRFSPGLPHNTKSTLMGAFCIGAGDRGRTCTVAYWFLRPARLPIPPRPQVNLSYYSLNRSFYQVLFINPIKILQTSKAQTDRRLSTRGQKTAVLISLPNSPYPMKKIRRRDSFKGLTMAMTISIMPNRNRVTQEHRDQATMAL